MRRITWRPPLLLQTSSEGGVCVCWRQRVAGGRVVKAFGGVCVRGGNGGWLVAE